MINCITISSLSNQTLDFHRRSASLNIKGMTSSANVKRLGPPAEKRVDNENEFYPPLDYSFHNAQRIEDALILEPRLALGSPEPVKEEGRYHSYGINLNHNMLNGSLENFPDLLRQLLVRPEALSTLDLSFNTFTEIPAAVVQFRSLKYFYFHRNLLSDLNELQKFRSLKELRHLTLHGNPLEAQVPYLRSYILCLYPHLRSFNCTAVSKGDLHHSSIWGEMHKNLLPKYSIPMRKK